MPHAVGSRPSSLPLSSSSSLLPPPPPAAAPAVATRAATSHTHRGLAHDDGAFMLSSERSGGLDDDPDAPDSELGGHSSRAHRPDSGLSAAEWEQSLHSSLAALGMEAEPVAATVRQSTAPKQSAVQKRRAAAAARRAAETAENAVLNSGASSPGALAWSGRRRRIAVTGLTTQTEEDIVGLLTEGAGDTVDLQSVKTRQGAVLITFVDPRDAAWAVAFLNSCDEGLSAALDDDAPIAGSDDLYIVHPMSNTQPSGAVDSHAPSGLVCEHCTYDNPSTNVECAMCGSALPGAAHASAAGRTCHACGMNCPVDADYCPGCHRQLLRPSVARALPAPAVVTARTRPCPICTCENKVAAIWCKACGTSLALVPTDGPIVTRDCPKCGLRNLLSSKNCVSCRAPMVEMHAGDSEAASLTRGVSWECGTCGFHNPCDAKKCGMCNAQQLAPPHLEKARPAVQPETTTCPVCSKSVRTADLDAHIDDCLSTNAIHDMERAVMHSVAASGGSSAMASPYSSGGSTGRCTPSAGVICPLCNRKFPASMIQTHTEDCM